ncbi:MBL fold metallo-hydrolase [Roseisalinus antarcticus]|uniref:Hydroxyacylglutathione hydrolase n=1 Tax=Roseisalinus antarcticus TaxID=254357 RepID=A0A1Y5TTA0_9RHOB|nr:MBL fold metallo-hydrolase [Roseisalinus antarcticus]SLN71493.1 Hydroxyacylglutathione hydrolase [Roseisalinus antarcticus]
MSRQPPRAGAPQPVAPGVLRILAPNPSPMTFLGTNSYVLGDRDVAVIDPGPDDPAHLQALLAAIAGRPLRAILVTHAHLDHAALVPALSRRTGAPVMARGPAGAGRSAVMTRLAATGSLGGGEGVMSDFVPAVSLADGEAVSGADWALKVLYTPGHFGNHICLLGAQWGFSGDHVMGWASTLISPPDGDLTDFMASCAQLCERRPPLLLPGHGPVIVGPRDRIDWLLAHRRDREAQIIEALAKGPSTLPRLTARLYADTPENLLPAAARNVLAHLVDLHGRGLVKATPTLTLQARFCLS